MKLCKLFLLILAIFPFAAVAELGYEIDGSLDKEKITKLYFEGNFESVTNILENHRKRNPDLSDEDKIFVYKYLAVVYAANPATVDKGESYMYQLLKLVPSIELIDMYISDNIKAIFNNVKTEYERLMSYQGKDSPALTDSQEDEEPNSNSQPTDPEPAKPKKSKAWIWWTAGGVALTATVVAFVLFSGGDDGEASVVVNN